MSMRTRLQAFIDTQQKIRIRYGYGYHQTVTGRVLNVDHDHIDIESYCHEEENDQICIRRILVPLHLIIDIDITPAEILTGVRVTRSRNNLAETTTN